MIHSNRKIQRRLPGGVAGQLGLERCGGWHEQRGGRKAGGLEGKGRPLLISVRPHNASPTCSAVTRVLKT